MTPFNNNDNFSHFRRYLLVISSVLAVFGGSDIRVELAPVVGNASLVGRVWALYALVWLFSLYAFFGFVVYFYTERLTGFSVFLSDAKREGVRHYLHHLGRRSGWAAQRTEARGEVSVWPMDIEVEIYKHFEPEAQSRGYGSERPAQNVVEQGFVRINRFLWSMLVVRSLSARLLFGPTFFQYVLPPLWLVAAVLLANNSGWTGSLESVWASAWNESTQAPRRPDVLQPTMCEWKVEDRKH